MSESTLEARMALLLRAWGLPEPERQYRWSYPRRHRADFAWPRTRVLLEVEGGTWARASGHSGGAGIRKDCERLNLAQSLGWRYYRATADMIREGCPTLMPLLCKALGVEMRKER
jgi:very-short-patch-repair endonuclease